MFDDEVNRGITIGIVVEDNDPMQMGRLRVACPSWGEDPDGDPKNIPWAMYGSPFAGVVDLKQIQSLYDEQSEGKFTYGLWMIPRKGSLVLTFEADNDPKARIWFACLYYNLLPHTMPHGRFPDNKGPLTHNETPLMDFYRNALKAFGSDVTPEKLTRINDRTVSAIDEELIEYVESKQTDNKDDGYAGGKSEIYNITTPSGHSISMDDNVANRRLRIRTSSGHQIIFDDTNERIYLMTAEGNNWIELDSDGHIDIFSNKKISIRTNGDFNVYSEGKIRMHGKQGIVLGSDEGDFSVFGGKGSFDFQDTFVVSSQDASISVANFAIKSSKTSFDVSKFDLKSGGSITFDGTGAMNIKSSSNVFVKGSMIFLNSSSPPSPASTLTVLEPLTHEYPTRIPNHEPWVRTDTKDPTSIAPKYKSSDSKAGTNDSPRNKYWKR